MAEEGAIAVNTTVKDVMTTHVVAVRLKATYKDMATRLREFRVSAFPVLDNDNRVVGVVSEADLLTKEALEYSTAGVAGGILHGRERAKAEIRHDIIENVVIGTVLTDPARFIVTVDNGIVKVEGIPENETVGRDMIEEIRHIEGVVAVRDFLTRVKEQRFVQRTDPDLDF